MRERPFHSSLERVFAPAFTERSLRQARGDTLMLASRFSTVPQAKAPMVTKRASKRVAGFLTVRSE